MTPSLHNQHLDECRGKIHAHGYKATARESGVPETTVRRFAYKADILHRSTMKLLAWAFPVGMPGDGWISVKERLPVIPFGVNGPYAIQVICAVFDESEKAHGFTGYHIELGLYSYDDDRIADGPLPDLDPSIEYKVGFQFLGYGEDHGFEWEKNIPWHEVTHWQPLPSSPKESQS